MSDEKQIAVVQIEFYVEDSADYEAKAERILDYAEENMGCSHCECDWSIDTDTECEKNCGNVCNLIGAHHRLLTEEEFDREFLSDE